MTTTTDTRPPEGWSEPDRHGHITFVKHAANWLHDDPPEREGFEVYFIGRHGAEYTRWSYRPVKEA